MKFSIAKLPKTFQKHTKRSSKAKQKKQQKIKLNRGSKRKYTLRWKSFVTWKIVILKIKIEPVSITATANCNEHIL